MNELPKMPSNAKEMQKMFDGFSRDFLILQINLLLYKSLDLMVHQVNELFIYKAFGSENQVINKKTMTIKFFDTYEEALDYCLDNFDESKEHKQQSLF